LDEKTHNHHGALKKNGLLISALGPELWRIKDSVLFGDGALISLRPLYNKIVCFAGVNDTGEAPEKSNISANIRKKLKSSLGLPTGARRSCMKNKKQRGKIWWHCLFKGAQA
jgi:hypothetical protein